MRKILRPLLIRTHRAIKLGGLDSEATVSFTRCFKDSKTKCDKAGKEISKKPAGGKNKGKRAPDQGSGATLRVLGYPN